MSKEKKESMLKGFRSYNARKRHDFNDERMYKIPNELRSKIDLDNSKNYEDSMYLRTTLCKDVYSDWQ